MVYIRYYHVKKCINLDNESKSDLQIKGNNKLNKTAFLFGLASCFGVVVVGQNLIYIFF